MSFFVYILESMVDGSLYTGQTNNLNVRLRRHNSGHVRTTKKKKPYELKYYEVFETRSQAMFREWELKKKWNTERKRKLIGSFDKSKLRVLLGL